MFRPRQSRTRQAVQLKSSLVPIPLRSGGRGRCGFGSSALVLALLLDRLEDGTQLAARPLDRGGQVAPRREEQAHELADRLFAGRQLADLLDALVTDVD